MITFIVPECMGQMISENKSIEDSCDACTAEEPYARNYSNSRILALVKSKYVLS